MKTLFTLIFSLLVLSVFGQSRYSGTFTGNGSGLTNLPSANRVMFNQTNWNTLQNDYALTALGGLQVLNGSNGVSATLLVNMGGGNQTTINGGDINATSINPHAVTNAPGFWSAAPSGGGVTVPVPYKLWSVTNFTTWDTSEDMLATNIIPANTFLTNGQHLELNYQIYVANPGGSNPTTFLYINGTQYGDSHAYNTIDFDWQRWTITRTTATTFWLRMENTAGEGGDIFIIPDIAFDPTQPMTFKLSATAGGAPNYTTLRSGDAYFYP